MSGLSGQYSNLFAGAKDVQFIFIFAEKHKNYIKLHFKLNANFSLRQKYTVYNWKPFSPAKSGCLAGLVFPMSLVLE
jgi:hypothetical protein